MMKRTLLVTLFLSVLVFLGAGRIFAQSQTITSDELSTFDGKDGRKAYYAYEGVIYDATNSPQWKLGQHFGLSAGRDLTGKLEGAPHGDGLVKSMPVVGTLATTNTAAPTQASPVATSIPIPAARATTSPWWQTRIRILGISILGWTGIILAVVFILNFATCFALPWSKLPLPWTGSRPGADALDAANVHLKWAQIHKYFAWATVVVGIVHGVIGLLQVFGIYL